MVIILITLGSGMYFLVTDKDKSKRTVKALTLRILLSVALFLGLFFAFHYGLISPHGIGE